MPAPTDHEPDLGSLGLSGEQIRAVLTAGVRAPSVHNSQPWLFAVHPDRIDVFADFNRRLPHADPHDKGLYLSCGAVLMNLRVALLAAGVRPLVTVLPASADPNAPVGVIRYGGSVEPPAAAVRLAAAIPRRRTNRKPYQDTKVTQDQRAALVRAVQAEGAWAHLVEDPQERAQVRGLVVQAQHEQQQNPGYVAEFAHWVTGDSAAGVGIPATSAGPVPAAQDEWVLRDFAAGRGSERLPGKDFESDPMIMVVCSYYDGKLAEIAAGQAMQNVLLTATDLGLASSFLSQPLEVAHTRKELRTVVGGTVVPQTILRFGLGSPVRATPRRTVDDVLIPAV